MNFSDDKSKALAEMDWSNQVIISEMDISGWVSDKDELKSKSLEFRNTPIGRRKFRIPSPIRIRKYLSPVLHTPQTPLTPLTPQIPIKSISPNGEKIETLLIKILEKSQQKIKIKDRDNSYFKANRLGIQIPSINYTINLPRPLSMNKTSKQVKSLYKTKKIQPLVNKFSYKYARSSYVSSRHVG